MTDNVENHTIRLLQEMRDEFRQDIADLRTRIDGNTLILNMLAGHLHDHEMRLQKIESKSK